MVVQACLNGARSAGYHPRLPLLLNDVVDDAIECVRAGAAELHLHVRDKAGSESLQPDAVAATIGAFREALPGTLIGVSGPNGSRLMIRGDSRSLRTGTLCRITRR